MGDILGKNNITYKVLNPSLQLVINFKEEKWWRNLAGNTLFIK